MDLLQEGIRSMIKNFNSSSSEQPNDFRADNIAIKAAVEFCNRINAFNFLFTDILKLFSEENKLEDKFIENLEPFILGGYFKGEHLPDPVLKKICDHYFNNEKYHNFERVVSKLNFSHYALFDQLETICKEKMLTTALIHLIITSTTGNDKKACTQILNNVVNRFKQAKKCRSLDEIKEMLWKDNDSKHAIEASYQYIGLKLMYITKLFMRGDKFPSGKLTKNQRPLFLEQSIEFLMREDEAVELLKLNSRTFFMVSSEIFLNDFVADSLAELNSQLDENGEPVCPYTHMKIVDSLQSKIFLIQNEPHIQFEYSYFIIKIAASRFCKDNSDEFAGKVYNSVLNFLNEFIKHKETPVSELENKYKYAGPDGVSIQKVEEDVLRVLHFYTPKMDNQELGKLIDLAESLKLDHMKIHLYEQKQEFDRCMSIYLESPRVKSDTVFKWLFDLYKRKDKFNEKKIEDLRNKISRVIEELVIANPENTGDVIEMWLPDKQREVIDKLSAKPELQLKYLEAYLKEREDDIKEKCTTSSLQIMSNPEANNYKEYLAKHVELLAKNNDPKLIEVVKKSFYPLGCLEKFKKSTSALI